MVITEIQASSILTKSKLPEADYCINPYVGCSHRCIYCYAVFMRRFTSHIEPWGEFIDIKMNSVELLQKKRKAIAKQEGTIIIGSVTDAYQPLEYKYNITRNLLKELLNTDCKITILTKSRLVLRDIDLIKQFKNITIGVSLTTTDDNARKIIEPGTSSVANRIDTLNILHSNKIRTYAFIGPIIPGITDMRAIFKLTQGKIDEIWGERLNIKSGNWDTIQTSIEQNLKNYYPFFINKIKDNNYWIQVKEEFKNLCIEYNIPMVGFYNH